MSQGKSEEEEFESSMQAAKLASTLELLTTINPDVSDELAALSSIYDSAEGAPSLSLFVPAPTSRSASPNREWTPTGIDPLRLVLATTVSDSHDYPLHLLISLPPAYPASEPPLLQLHDRYIGPELVSDELFSMCVRTFMHEDGGVAWREGEVCLFEGVEWVRERCAEWVKEKEEERSRKEVVRLGVSQYRIGGDDRKEEEEQEEIRDASYYEDRAMAKKIAQEEAANARSLRQKEQRLACPQIFSSAPIQDRGSTFVGHAAAVHSVEEVTVHHLAERVFELRLAG
ncbi:hypothetical protein P7C70_g5584, partial [Phenoliferia sp. Uapishka_3]